MRLEIARVGLPVTNSLTITLPEVTRITFI